MPQPDWAAWLAVAVIGAAIGIAELVVRYEGRLPLLRGLFRASVAAYVALNALASLAAIALLQARGGALGPGDVLLAGISAGILLRAGVTVSLPNGRQTTKGPGERLQALLQVADRAVSRDLQTRFEEHAVRLFQSVPGFSIEPLVEYVSIREALSARDRKALQDKIDALEKSQLEGALFLAGLALALHEYCTLPTLETWQQHVRTGAQHAQAGAGQADVTDVTDVIESIVESRRGIGVQWAEAGSLERLQFYVHWPRGELARAIGPLVDEVHSAHPQGATYLGAMQGDTHVDIYIAVSGGPGLGPQQASQSVAFQAVANLAVAHDSHLEVRQHQDGTCLYVLRMPKAAVERR